MGAGLLSQALRAMNSDHDRHRRAIHADVDAGHIAGGIRSQEQHGTGDFLSGLYLAERLRLPPKLALASAMKTLSRAIALSAGTPVLQVAAALHTT